MLRNTSSLAVALSAALSLSGCAMAKKLGITSLSTAVQSPRDGASRGPSDTPKNASERLSESDLYPADERCQKWAQSTGAIPRHGYSFYKDEKTEAELVLAITCHKSFGSGRYDTTTKTKYGQLHFGFDDRSFNHLHAAMAITLCASSDSCQGPIASGLFGFYAKHTDKKQVAAAVAKLPVDDDVKEVFLRRFDASLVHIGAKLKELDPRRMALYHEIPEQVFAARKAERKTYASYWSRYDSLAPKIDQVVRAGKGDVNLIVEAILLRDDYMKQCLPKKDLETCIHGPIARPLTESIARLAVMGGDALLAHAENQLLSNSPERASWAAELFFSQYSAMAAERKKYDEFARAQRDGVDETTLAGMYGEIKPIKIDAASAWRPNGGKTSFGALIQKMKPQPMSAGGVIKSVSRKGKLAQVSFKTEVSKWNETDCKETNRIDRIDDNGNIVYRKKCKFVRQRTSKHTPKPVYVPADEARTLSRGDYLVAVVAEKGRKGHVMKAYSSDKRQKVTQIRRFRIKK